MAAKIIQQKTFEDFSNNIPELSFVKLSAYLKVLVGPANIQIPTKNRKNILTYFCE